MPVIFHVRLGWMDRLEYVIEQACEDRELGTILATVSISL